MKYRITHKTLYSYNEAVSLCHNEAHLLLRNGVYQTCLNSELMIDPLPIVQQDRIDYFGNRVSYFAIQSPHKVLTITADSIVDVSHPGEIYSSLESPSWEYVRDLLMTDTSQETLFAREFVLDSPFASVDNSLMAFALPSFTRNRPILEATHDLMRRIFTEFTYDPHFTTIVTPLSDVLLHRRGVCQDFAHLMIACIRSLGLAARYVSGYLETLPPPGQQKLQGSDASHAWIAVYVPVRGWIDFDPTNNQIPTDQHITTAWGRDYSDVTPLKGIIFGGGEHVLSVSVDVNRISEPTYY
jgi:transglutaminase-like putative cysteine protease